MRQEDDQDLRGMRRIDEFDLSFKVFHELMARKVNEILLVSTPYDAFIMEEEGRLAERIIHEYRGLNLSRPPHLTWVSTAREAIATLSRKSFDLVLTMPLLDDMDAFGFIRRIKKVDPDLPVFLLAHRTNRHLFDPGLRQNRPIDKVFVWSGNTDLLLALIKSVEDRMNIDYDTRRAKVRVLIVVEDSPIYYSSMLPLLYREIVVQTQAVMEDSLNDEHRILRMRARPKILLAETFEEAEALYRRFQPYLLSIFSDVRFPRHDKMDEAAGFSLLKMVRDETPDIPLLMLSSEEKNRLKADEIPAVFLNKNSPSLHTDIREFFKQYLGFGDFIFRLPDGTEVGRVSNLREMQKILPSIPDASIFYHACRNHFSSWLMARSEIMLATKLKPVKATEFDTVGHLKRFLIQSVAERRKGRQKGIISQFDREHYDPDAEFVKMGKGSLGGKARGLAFMSIQLKEDSGFRKRFGDIDIHVPQALVISTEVFDEFMAENTLEQAVSGELRDEDIAARFLDARFPEWLREDLELVLSNLNHPLAVRSSSLLEDAQFQPFAGIYRTYMLPNRHPDPALRLARLIQAIKLVYASTYMAAPRAYAKSTMHRTEDEKMAVIVQRLTGAATGSFYYPAISGVAQSYNFYPVGAMKPEEGIASIAMGLGKTVVEGGRSLRFSPRYPQLLPQFSTVEDILKNSQRFFYALDLRHFPDDFGASSMPTDETTLVRIDIDAAKDHPAVRHLCSTYSPQDHRIRDAASPQGHPVVTFAAILKYQSFPLADILTEILDIGRRGMGCPVEIEFAVNLPLDRESRSEFALLQIRPMAISRPGRAIDIAAKDMTAAFCHSSMALGHGWDRSLHDIIFVRPDTFDASQTVAIAREIGHFNGQLAAASRKFLLIGPGRWGSADRWLGIPVAWNDISGVGTIVETRADELKADPSQGSHFFHNITSLGISYLNLVDNDQDFLDWRWLNSLPVARSSPHVTHVTLEQPITIKIDGKTSRAVLLKPGAPEDTAA
ncbi:MAG: PEP/pyruvate-binding domain-containing protein [Desulfobacterales bacterium]